jgi:hypothetical protein
MRFGTLLLGFVALNVAALVVIHLIHPPPLMRHIRRTVGAQPLNASQLVVATLAPSPSSAAGGEEVEVVHFHTALPVRSRADGAVRGARGELGARRSRGGAADGAERGGDAAFSPAPRQPALISVGDANGGGGGGGNAQPPVTPVAAADVPKMLAYFDRRLSPKVRMTFAWNLLVDYSVADWLVHDVGLKYVAFLDANMLSLGHFGIAVACIAFLVASVREVPVAAGTAPAGGGAAGDSLHLGGSGEGDGADAGVAGRGGAGEMAAGAGANDGAGGFATAAATRGDGDGLARHSSVQMIEFPASPSSPESVELKTTLGGEGLSKRNVSQMFSAAASAGDGAPASPLGAASAALGSAMSVTPAGLGSLGGGQIAPAVGAGVAAGTSASLAGGLGTVAGGVGGMGGAGAGETASADLFYDDDDKAARETASLLFPGGGGTGGGGGGGVGGASRVVIDPWRLKVAAMLLLARNFVDNVDGVLARAHRQMGVPKRGPFASVSGALVDAVVDIAGSGLCCIGVFYVLYRRRVMLSPLVSRALAFCGLRFQRQRALLVGAVVAFLGAVGAIGVVSGVWESTLLRYMALFEQNTARYAVDLAPVEQSFAVTLNLFLWSAVCGDAILTLLVPAMFFDLLWETAQYLCLVHIPVAALVAVYSAVVWQVVVLKNPVAFALVNGDSPLQM